MIRIARDMDRGFWIDMMGQKPDLEELDLFPGRKDILSHQAFVETNPDEEEVEDTISQN